MSVFSQKKIVVLGTGGTIAGTSSVAGDNIGYTAAQVGVGALLQASGGPVATGFEVVSEQVAQLDSKDMSHAVWRALFERVVHWLAQPQVAGVVITHGTDTLEETAYFLHATLSAEQLKAKPVVLTCAMRPSDALVSDGPQNLRDALAVVSSGASAAEGGSAITPGDCAAAASGGVVVVCAGKVHTALDLQKVHTYRLDAFDSGDSGPMGFVEEGSLRLTRNWPLAQVLPRLYAIENVANDAVWPRVEIVMSHAGASGLLVDALVAQSALSPNDPLRGIVVAATGNGTVHSALQASLISAQASGITVVVATRCAYGRVLPTAHSRFEDSNGLSPVKARVALMLRLL